MIEDFQKAHLIAPYSYILEDFRGNITYEHLVQMPKDSFRLLSEEGIKGYITQPKAIWLRIELKNTTGKELFLLSRSRAYHRLDVYVLNETGRLTHYQVGTKQGLENRAAPTAKPLVSLGVHPRLVHIAMYPNEIFRDKMEIITLGQAVYYQKRAGFWQGIIVGAYLLLLMYAIIFCIRLRYPILGWYALFLFSYMNWFLTFYGYFDEWLGYGSIYLSFLQAHYTGYIATLCWAVFHIKFLHLKKYSPLLYLLLAGWLGIDAVNQLYLVISTLLGSPLAPLDILLSWMGIDWAMKGMISFLLMLISLLYVSHKNFGQVRWYALGFGIGLSSMLLSYMAVYNISWLPYLPYNQTHIVGSIVEIIIFAYAIANQHRQQQQHTQQELIAQLQENLRQQDKLLRIRDEIARDLHDEVGATLTSIAISTKLVQKKVAAEQSDINPILDQIKADSEDTIHSIRDTVWALNPDNDAPEKFLERLRTVAFQLLANGSIDLTFDRTVELEALPPFSMELRRNLYLAYKEALHNIVKHAEASEVHIQISQSEGLFQVIISDNGRGFDRAVPADGNGLVNFQKRANEGGFTLELRSEPGSGTTICMKASIQETLSEVTLLSHSL